MNVRQLAQYLQMKMHEDLAQGARDEAVTATAALITQARANANAAGKDPNEAASKVEPVRPRPVDDEVPTLDWCARIAKKHSLAARNKIGKLEGLREEILALVKADPDKKGKLPPASPGRGGRP